MVIYYTILIAVIARLIYVLANDDTANNEYAIILMALLLVLIFSLGA